MKRLFPALCLFSWLIAGLAFAGSAAWMRNPADGDWNDPANWVGDGPPNGTGDVATFNFSRLTNLFLSTPTTLDSLVFTHQAAGITYMITAPTGTQLSFVGAGISGGGPYQEFVSEATGGPGGGFTFSNSASSGAFTIFTNRGGTATGESGGFVEFLDNSQGPDGVFSSVINEGGTVAGAGGGFTELRGAASGNSTEFFNRAGVVGASGGSTSFYDSATADSEMSADGAAAPGAGPGSIHYYGSSSGGGTLTADGGTNGGDGGLIEIRDNCPGGFGKINVLGNGVVDLSNHNPAVPVTVGAIEGEGSILLGGSNLTIGVTVDQSFEYFDGVISDGGTGGSLTIISSGTVTSVILSGANTYTGGTTVDGGALFVLKNPNGSGTGRGPVNVQSGILGGTGVIGGAVTIGNGSSVPGYLKPGPETGGIGVLTIQKKLTFKSDGIYTFQVNSNTGSADRLNAKGITIESGATIATLDLGTQASPPGTRYFVINNTSPSPITGSFSNLADGSTLTLRNNTYQVSYSGGDGDDLTLTVVP